jgi:NAD(P)-dependent dehydrogenase (short-subunit alcohol dehydrogenase family)
MALSIQEELNMDYTGKVVLITGGANGIGRCIVETFIKAGAYAAFADTDEAAGHRLAAQLGSNAMFFSGDIAEEQTLTVLADAVIRRFGHVDYLVNNACLTRRGLLSGCGWDDFNYVLRVGISAPYMLTKLLLPHFAENAAIVNISSSRAGMSQPNTESYTAAKGGISALTHAMAVSLAGRIRVNSISPGWIDTSAYHDGAEPTVFSPQDIKQHPAGRVGMPKDIAKAVLYLCSSDAGFIDGENIVVDGGMTRQMIYHADHGWRLD